MDLNVDELLFLEDEEALIGAIAQHVILAGGLFNVSFREYAPWVKIDVDVNGWRRLGDPTFKVHFRMCRSVYEDLLSVVGNHLLIQQRLNRIRTPLDLCLMMGLWVLMNMDTFKNVALHFKTTPGVVFFHYAYVIEAVRELAPDYIQWPTREERAVIKREFQASTGYEGVVSVIDGMHTFITAPLQESQAYVNRHHCHSILSQAVVDDQMLVRDLYVGEPGSLHDSRVFRRSPLCNNLLENEGFLNPAEHLLGDGAYIWTDKV